MIAKDAVYATVKAVNQADQVDKFYLHLEPVTLLDKPLLLPSVLGTGRNAVVFLATTTPIRESEANSYRAIKFLRDDIDHQYAQASAERFFQEAEKAKRFDRLQGTFVKYFGIGSIGPREASWWGRQLIKYADALLADASDENSTRLENIRQHFKLQGPFYVLDLCQGTLHDLLDRDIPWLSLPAYTITKFRESLLNQGHRVHTDIEAFREKYLERHPAGRSGYDILNDFRNDPVANRVRNHAVLDIFRQVTLTISELHKQEVIVDSRKRQRRTIEPLAHRDLKPGNIFFQHDANIGGVDDIRIQLSDLGYVTTAGRITRGDVTLLHGNKGIEYQAPGSQYYRAPEQAELPVEVRVDIDRAHSNRVRVYGSKVDRIEVHDWLLLSDVFNNKDTLAEEQEDPRLFKIKEVQRVAESGGVYHLLTLQRPQDNSTSEISLLTTRLEDSQGHIIRATGFQTDGFSLGAILYDLISGGKDPQLFYTYCVISVMSQFPHGEDFSIDEIVEVLFPQKMTSNGSSNSEVLNFAERRHMMKALIEADDLDDLFDRIVEIAFRRQSYERSERLNFRQKLKIGVELLEKLDIDDLVVSLIRSPFFASATDSTDQHATPDTPKRHYQQELKNYRFRNFQLVSELLKDKRGVSIPRDILHIILCCMVRDAKGSYYRSDPIQGYTSQANFEAATIIHDDVSRLMGEPQYRLPEQGFPKSLEEDLLFKLRCLVLAPLEDEQSSSPLALTAE